MCCCIFTSVQMKLWSRWVRSSFRPSAFLHARSSQPTNQCETNLVGGGEERGVLIRLLASFHVDCIASKLTTA